MGGSVLAAAGDAALVLGGISWEPEIRGALVVLVGGTVLFGSVWLLLTTNIGNRLGALNALAGFFGWMFILGVVWWIYGFGLIGDPPAWEPKEVVFGDLVRRPRPAMSTTSVRPLWSTPLRWWSPTARVSSKPRCRRSGLGWSTRTTRPCSRTVYSPPADRPGASTRSSASCSPSTTRRSPRTSLPPTRPSIPRTLGSSTTRRCRNGSTGPIDDEFRRDQQLTLSAVASVSPELIDAAKADGDIDAQGWTLISNAEAGEAQATADAFLNETSIDPFDEQRATSSCSTPSRRAASPTARATASSTVSGTRSATPCCSGIPRTPSWCRSHRRSTRRPMPGAAASVPGDRPRAVKSCRSSWSADLGTRRLPAALMTIGSLIVVPGAVLDAAHPRPGAAASGSTSGIRFGGH